MAILTNEGRARLKDAVRLYLQSIANVNAAEQCTAYAPTLNYMTDFISRTFCSSARPADHPGYRLEIQDLLNNSGGVADRDRVNAFGLSPAHIMSIQQTLEKKRGVSVVYVVVVPDLPGHQHSCLLVFDARKKKQHFFNPWGYRNHWLSQAFAERPTLVPGFKVATLSEDNWPQVAQSLQYMVDRNHFNVQGNCSLYCILVGVLCTRFNFGKPRLMANLLKEALGEIDHANGFNEQNDNPASSHVSILWNWLGEMVTDADILAAPALDANSVVTLQMQQQRRDRRTEATETLQNFPHLDGSNPPNQVARRTRLRNRSQNYLDTSPELVVGSPVAPATIAERNQAMREAEVRLVRRMFPPAESCSIAMRKGTLCSRRACTNQPLCWQHRYYTRNHRLTGPGRMRCAAVQQPC